jgi:hypothetical protein
MGHPAAYRTSGGLADGLGCMWDWAKQMWAQYPERRNRKEPPVEAPRPRSCTPTRAWK